VIAPGQVRALFDRVAPRYDLLNHLFSFRRDLFWREAAARLLRPPVQGPLLDLACGTLDLSLALARRHPGRPVVGVDFSPGMLRLGRPKLGRPEGRRIVLASGDGFHLPLADRTFAGAAIAFGIRNMPDRPAALAELNRVLKPGGRLAVLELGLPRGLFRRIYSGYLLRLMPALARLFSADLEAYHYLGRSILDFPPPEVFLGLLAEAGFQAKALPLSRGIVWLFLATKPAFN